MKLAALAPAALFVLVSMCGSPVPPPPGSVSGLVYFDANHNGLRDNCDSKLGPVKLTTTNAEGKTAQATSNSDGTFLIENVPVGDSTVSMVAAGGFAWPITTTPEGAAGTPVHVESTHETTDVKIGSASRAAFPNASVSIIGVVFNDTNENGVLDLNECGRRLDVSDGQYVRISGRSFESVGQNGSFNITGLSEDSVVLNTRPTIEYIRGQIPEDQIGEDHPCLLRAKPQRRYTDNLFDAQIAFVGSAMLGSVSGHIFDDANGNGLRDAGEPGVSQQAIQLNPKGSICGGFSSDNGFGTTSAMTDDAGFFTVTNVPMGQYTIGVGGQKQFPEPSDSVALRRWPDTLTVIVRKVNPATVDLPMEVQQTSSIHVRVFDDANGDGVWNDGESPVNGYSLCARRTIDDPGDNSIYVQYDQACGRSDESGLLLLQPLLSGEYDLPTDYGYGGPSLVPVRAPPATQRLHLNAGEQLDLSLPLDVVSPAEQVIPAGTGTVVDWKLCYSDPEWVQPPFDDATVVPYYIYGASKEDVRRIYERGIYVGAGNDIGIWGQAIGRPDWLQMLTGCGSSGIGDYTNAYRTIVLVNHEPITVKTSGDVVQTTIVSRATGLYAVQLPESLFLPGPNGPLSFWYLFVDEDYNPIERLSAYNQSGGFTTGGY